MHWYVVFGYFKLAGILQQIYARYKNGQTTDERFATFGERVRTLILHAENLSRTGRRLSGPALAGQLSAVSLATDGEEIDWLKKRNIKSDSRSCVAANRHQKAEVLKAKPEGCSVL